MSNIHSEMLDEPWDDDCPEDLPDSPSAGEIAMQVWKSDEHIRAKYRGHFRHYLRAEHNLP